MFKLIKNGRKVKLFETYELARSYARKQLRKAFNDGSVETVKVSGSTFVLDHSYFLYNNPSISSYNYKITKVC